MTTTPQLPLEDNFNDIVSKAMRGLVLPESEAATRSGISRESLKGLLSGTFDEEAARKLAPTLGLNAEALAASGKKAWHPEPIQLDGLAQFTTPWDDMTVNSYLLWNPETREAVAFDTGADAEPMLDFARERGLKITLIALTHTHGDHVFDLDRLKEKTGARAIVGSREPLDGAEAIADVQPIPFHALKIEARLTWGHSRGGVTYVVHGLSRPVAIVGDAVFAGSMGGGMVSYADALRTNRAEILTLPDDTVLGPGHGPLTTVANEKRHNPFFAQA